jgi:hypothetical protein
MGTSGLEASTPLLSKFPHTGHSPGVCSLTEIVRPSSGEMPVAKDSYVGGSDSLQIDVTFCGQRNLIASETGAVDER